MNPRARGVSSISGIRPSGAMRIATLALGESMDRSAAAERAFVPRTGRDGHSISISAREFCSFVLARALDFVAVRAIVTRAARRNGARPARSPRTGPPAPSRRSFASAASSFVHWPPRAPGPASSRRSCSPRPMNNARRRSPSTEQASLFVSNVDDALYKYIDVERRDTRTHRDQSVPAHYATESGSSIASSHQLLRNSSAAARSENGTEARGFGRRLPGAI